MQVVGSDKSLETAVALVGAQTRVDAHVVLQVVVVGKSCPTLLAQVGLLTSMFPHVDLQLVLPLGRKGKEGRGNIDGRALEVIDTGHCSAHMVCV